MKKPRVCHLKGLKMPNTEWKYVFSGIVVPERALIHMSHPIKCNYNHQEASLKGSVVISIFKSQITIVFTSESKVDDLRTLKNLLADLASTIVDVAGLDAVVGYSVDIRSVQAVTENEAIVFGVDLPGLSIDDNEKKLVEITSMFFFAGTNPYFRRALNDFKNSILHPQDTGFFCYRAVESLIKFKEAELNTSDKKAAIDALEKALDLDVSIIKKLSKLAGGPRHGKPVWISGEDRKWAIENTREIIKHFFNRGKETASSPQKLESV